MNDQRPPRKLYRYRAWNPWTYALLAHGELYYSPLAEFKDAFEGEMVVDFSGPKNTALLQSRGALASEEQWPDRSEQDHRDAALVVTSAKREELAGPFQRELRRRLNAERDSKAAVCCFTERRDDHWMWSEYGDGSRGICLEFDTTAAFMRSARPVRYNDEPPSFSAVDIVTDDQLRLLAPWIFNKSSRYENEREWRLVNFDRGAGIRMIPLASITGVVLGCRMSDDVRSKVKALIRHRAIRLYEATPAGGGYKLNVIEIPKS